MTILKDGRFWGGVITGYILVVVFPQLNIRTRMR